MTYWQDRNNLCARMVNSRPVDGRPVKEVSVGEHKLEVVAEFCYLGDMLSSGGGCELASTVRCRTAWGKFRSSSRYSQISIFRCHPEAESIPHVCGV